MVKTAKIPTGLTKNISTNLIFIILVVVTQIGLLFIGKYLWNNYLVDSITFIKPLRSIIHLFAIIFLAKIIFT